VITTSFHFSLPKVTVAWRAERSDTALETRPALRRARDELESLGARVDNGNDDDVLRFSRITRTRGGPGIMSGRVRAERNGERISVTVQASFVPSLAFGVLLTIGPVLDGLPLLIGIVLGALVAAGAVVTATRLRGVAQAALSLNPPERAV